MGDHRLLKVQVGAARALVEWKSFFAEQVAAQAKEIAEESNSSGLITVDHYRQAAKVAITRLDALLQETNTRDGHQEAA